MIITLDGPTASGKSTVAAALAQRLEYLYINSGLLFRAVAYGVDQKILSADDPLFSTKAAELFHKKIVQYQYSPTFGAQIWYNKQNITPLLKSAAIDQQASIVALHPEIRTLLVEIERYLARGSNVIADGRDCGTVVFPEADYKLYITALPEIRAARWRADQAAKGIAFSLEECKQLIEERDKRDSERTLAPLTIPPAARIIDSSSLTIEQVVAHCLKIITG